MSSRARASALGPRLALLAALAALLAACPSPPAAESSPTRPGIAKGGAKPPPGPTFRAAPEVFWYNLYMRGRKAGFTRGEYGKGQVAPFQFQNLIILNLDRRTRIAERAWWEFEKDLKPINFFQKTINWRGGLAVTNTVDGVFHYDKGNLAVEYNEWGADEKVKVPIPPAQISRYVQNLVFARARLKVGLQFAFTSYSIRLRKFIKLSYKITGYDQEKRVFKFESRSPEALGATSIVWFQTATAEHPNGYVLRTSTPGPGGANIESEPTTRDQAIEGFEREAQSLKI